MSDKDCETAVQLIEDIQDLAESEDLPAKAREFAESVSATASEIGETIEQRGDVTDAQMHALENMLAGLEAWF